MFDPSKYLVGVRTVPDVIENVSAYQLKGEVASYRVSTGSGEVTQGSAYADIGDANVLIASAVEIRICAGIMVQSFHTRPFFYRLLWMLGRLLTIALILSVNRRYEFEKGSCWQWVLRPFGLAFNDGGWCRTTIYRATRGLVLNRNTEVLASAISRCANLDGPYV